MDHLLCSWMLLDFIASAIAGKTATQWERAEMGRMQAGVNIVALVHMHQIHLPMGSLSTPILKLAEQETCCRTGRNINPLSKGWDVATLHTLNASYTFSAYLHQLGSGG